LFEILQKNPTMMRALNRPSFWRRGFGIFVLFFLLAWNHETSAQGYKLRFTDTAAGAITFTGNALGLNSANGAGSVEAFITTNISLNAGGGNPNGTTLNWSNDSSSAVLRMPTNSTVLYAELIWAGTCETVSNAAANSPSNVLSFVTNTSVQFFLPDGSSNNVAPDPATLTIVTNFNTGVQQALFYVRSADVTALVKAAGTGTYTVGGVPAEISPLDGSDDVVGWTLAVAYANSSLHQRNLSIFVGDYWINAASAANSPPVGISGFCAPPTGTVNGYLFASTMEGDSQTVGDHLQFGVTTNSFVDLSGPNNPVNNFFCSQINYCQPDNLLGTTITNGYLDTSGTFGLSNSTPGSSQIYARQGWDITCVNASAALTNGVTSAFAKFITSGDGYSAAALALQIDVGSPVLTTSQTVDKGSTFVGDTLTYTVVVTNSGTADAVNLIFTDPLPFGTSYIPNTFTTNGVVIAGANPVNGVAVPIIKQNSSYTATYKVQVNQIPPVAKFVTAATINFQYAGACAQSPIINSTLVNADVQTLVPLLNVNKASSQTNLVPGSTFTYTINIPNVGTTNTSSSALNDQIPVGTTYVPGSTTNNGVHIPDIGPGGTNMPYTVTTEIHGPGRPAGEIDVGDTVVITFKVKISPTFPSYINNTATIFVDTNAPSSSQSAAANIPPFFCDLAAGIVGSPNPVAAGGPISYTVTVTNFGVNSVNDYTNFITLSLPLSQSILSPIYTPSIGTYNPLNGVWSGINLPSNGVVTLTISGTVSPNTTTSNIVSSVTVIPPSGLLDIVTNNNTATATNTIAQVADLAVTISDGVTNVHQGDALTYTVTAVNLGPSTLTSLTVSNSLSTNDLVFIPSLFANFTFSPDQGSFNPANGVWSGLDLQPGDSATLTLQATVLNNVSGFFTNTVIVSVPAGVTDPVLTNNIDSDVDLILTAPDVAITKAGPATVFAGTNYSYTLTLTNSGFATASNVVASDVLPTNVTFVSASGNGTNNSGVVSWNLGSLAINASSNLTLIVTAPTSGNVTNVATSTASTPDSNPGNNTSPPVGTTVTPVADLAIGKSAPASVVATSNFTYTVSVTNFGPSDAGGVVVTDTLPATVTFVSASGGGVNTGGVVNWTLGTLNSGDVSNLTVTVKAPASGSLTNIATLSSTTLDTNAVNNTSPTVITTVSTLALSADVSVTKSGPASVFAGTNFSYTITVTNSGPSSASNVVASDVLPTNVVFVSASGNGTDTAGTVSWSFGTLVINAKSNLTLTVTAPASGTITNTATVVSTTADPVPVNNTSPPVGTTVTPVADVVVLNVGPPNVLAGAVYTNTISVTNLGPSTASNIVVVDTEPGGVLVTNTVTSLPSGEGTNFSVTETAPASGPLTNSASSTATTGDPNPGNNTNILAVTPVTPVADIVVGNVGPPNVLAGAVYTNTISVTNLGPSTASNIVVIDIEPGGVLVTNTVTNLPPGGVTNFFVTQTAPGSGPLTNNASSTAVTFDPNPGNNTNILAVTTVTPVADIAVGKAGPASVFATSNFTYTVSVTNLGPSTASSVLVTDTLPAVVKFASASGGGATNLIGQVIWTMSTLTAGQVSNVTLMVTAPAGGTITNFASAGWPGGDPNPTNNTSPPVTTPVTPVADVVLTNVGPASVLAGATYTNTISVTNAGPSVATNVVVVDTEPDGTQVTNTFASLPPGGGTNFTVVETAPGGGPLTNSASSTAGTGDPNPVNNTNILAVTAVTPVADISVTKAGPATVFAGTNFNYSITVTNAGPSTASNVVASDVLPTNVVFVSAGGGGTTNPVGVAVWAIGTLASGASSNVTVTVTAPAVGTITNSATVSSPTSDPNPTNNTSPPVGTTVTPVADLSVGKSAPASVVALSNFTYTVSVTNLGPSAAGGVVVTDALPFNVTFVSTSGGGVNIGGIVNWSVGILNSGQVSNLTLVVKAPASGSITNTATANSPTGDPNPTNNTSPPVTTTVTPVADLAVGKSGAASVIATSNLVYTISVTNLGPSTASGVVVTDSLPAGATFVLASGLGVNNGGVVNWSLGSLTAGQVSNLNLTVNAPAGGTLTNTAIVSSPTLDTNFVNNTSPPVSTAVMPLADVIVTDSGPPSVPAGGTIVYTITVTNSGPSTASNVVVNDNLPTNSVFVSTTGGGTNGNGIVTWPVIPALTNGGTFTFTVTVTAPLTGPLTNTAAGVSPTSDPNLANNNGTSPAATVITAVTPVADLAAGKSGPASVLAMSNLTYTISVTNLGPSTAGAVVVTDALPVGVTFVLASGGGVNGSGVVSWSLGSLTSGQVSNLTLTVTAPAGGSITNTATVNSPTPDPNPTNNTSPPVGTIVTPVADVVTVGTGPANVFAGTNYIYTITVTNLGPSGASNIVVVDTLPPGVIFVGTTGGGTNNNGIVTWPAIPGLPVGGGTNFTVTVTAPGSGPLTNSVSSTASTGDPNPANNTGSIAVTTVTPVADLAVGKSAPASVVALSNFTYTVSVTNLGPSAAGGVVVTDALPFNVTFVSASGGGVNIGGIVNWSVGILNSGQVGNLTLIVKAPAAGSITNTAKASSPTGDPNPTNNTSSPVTTTVTTLAQSADIGVTETGPANVLAGANYSYTITVTNSGPTTASNVVASDVLPTNVLFVSAGGGGTTNAGVVSWPVGTLAVGATTNVTFTVTAPAGGTVTNSATVASTTADPNPANNTSSLVVTTVIPPASTADLAVGKSGPASIFAGTNFSYSISVTNLGPATATGLSVTDNLPAGLVFVSATPGAVTNAGNQVVWTNLNSLASGAVTNLTLTVTATLRASVTNFASAGSPTLDTNVTNNVSSPVVTAVTNRPPVAVNDIGSTPKNVAVSVPVLTNDFDPDGDTLIIVSVSPTNGTAVIVGTNVVFTPATNFLGTATIGYTISDGNGGTNTALITISVTNRPPVANSQLVTTSPNTPVPITLTGSDPDNDTLTFIIVTGPTNGVLSLLNTNTGTVTYTPNLNVTSPDSFTFRVNDGTTNSAIATVTISMSPPADIAVFKTGPAIGVAGFNLTYTITVTNSGPGGASNVVVSDQLPSGFTFISAVPATATVSNNFVIWPALNLAAGGRSNFVVTAVSAQGGSFTNIASGITGTFDPNPTNNNGTATNSQVVTTVTPLADVAIFKTGSATIAAGGTLTYTITATNSGPSTATNVVVQDNLPASVAFQSASGGGGLSGNVVSWPAMILTNGSATNFTVTVIAPASGSFTNIASGTSGTPDPNPTNNNGTLPGSKVTTSVTPVADVQIFVFGPTNVTVGDGFFYTILVTNAGPATAINTLVTNVLPTNVVFASASGGGVLSGNVVTWPVIPSLTNGQATNLILTVTPQAGVSTNSPTSNPFNFVQTNTTASVGFLTNSASAFAATFDPNLTNNSASSAYTNAQVQTVIVPGVFSIFIATNTYPTNGLQGIITNTIIPIGPNLFIVGTSAFNPQTGLYEENVTVTNIGTVAVHALRLYVGGLRSGVTIYNATGTNNGVPYVQYDPPYNSPLLPYPAAGSSVTFLLEFFVSDRHPFTNNLSAVAILAPPAPTVNGTPVTISQFQDLRNSSNPRFLIQFNSIPGRTYTILYSDNLMTWNVAVPSIVASANVTQWYDDGPPKTLSKPTSVGSRFYQVFLDP